MKTHTLVIIILLLFAACYTFCNFIKPNIVVPETQETETQEETADKH